MHTHDVCTGFISAGTVKNLCIKGCRKLREVFGVSALLPVVPEAAALRVEKCPVIDASRVDKWTWLEVRAKGEISEVISPACDCFVSQGGSVVGGTEVRERALVPKTEESDD